MSIEKIINETIPLNDSQEANKPKKPKKDNSQKGDIFVNCRCCGACRRGDFRSNLDGRYCHDCR